VHLALVQFRQNAIGLWSGCPRFSESFGTALHFCGFCTVHPASFPLPCVQLNISSLDKCIRRNERRRRLRGIFASL
jgi:hypothetical protein